jgi:uncharacterized integral membrane protein
MRYLVWALRLIVFVAVLMFALKNTDPVGVTFYGTWAVQSVPLIVVMLSTFDNPTYVARAVAASITASCPSRA